jgi:glucose/arabinose dehydrogenase
MIYMTVGIGDNEAIKAQDLNELAGKVLRLKDDGTVPPDNPFVNRPGGMRQGEVPRSGQLDRIDFNDKWQELHRESMFHELQNRIRDAWQGPDGLLYVLTEEADGALMKMKPWTAP